MIAPWASGPPTTIVLSSSEVRKRVALAKAEAAAASAGAGGGALAQSFSPAALDGLLHWGVAAVVCQANLYS